MRPVCIECCREMAIKKNGVVIIAAENHYYSGDLYECKRCLKEVVNACGNGWSLRDSKRLDLKMVVADLRRKS